MLPELEIAFVESAPQVPVSVLGELYKP